MQKTTEVGVNRSGMQVAPDGGEKMLENIQLTKPRRGDERELAKIRTEYARDADPVGTLPDPAASGVMAVLMDKLGARLAFERAEIGRASCRESVELWVVAGRIT